jgi:hypothetical protein
MAIRDAAWQFPTRAGPAIAWAEELGFAKRSPSWEAGEPFEGSRLDVADA